MAKNTGPARRANKNQDPRRNARATGSSRATGPAGAAGPKRDKATIALAVTAAVLLIAVILFFDRRITGALFSPLAARLDDAPPPTIERVGTDAAPEGPPETGGTVDLGVPAEAENPIPELLPEDGGDTDPRDDAPPAAESTARLFFVKVSDEGQISIKSVIRPVPATASPLTVAVNGLLEGPRPGEMSNDYLSLIPEGSRLLGARVDGGIAYLDFNEAFRFNALGLEGYRSQVEQLVFTATEFPTVDKVQILIEGQRVDYLGGEGFRVGSPLGRSDF